MSKFGWSLPPGCNTLPGEEDEAPLIADVCPNCLAVEVDWEDNKVNESWSDESGLYNKFVCPHCSHQIDSWDGNGFSNITSDEFADKVADRLPEGWEVLSTNNDWHKVEIGLTEGLEVIHGVEITVQVDEKGQIRLDDIDFDIKQFLRGVNLAKDPSCPIPYEEGEMVMQGWNSQSRNISAS